MEKEKYILITGASTGIGFDACRYLLKKGFHVIATVRKEIDKKMLLESFPNNLSVHILDVLKDEDINKLAGELKEKLSSTGLFGLINNAGIAKGGPLMHVSHDEFNLQMDTNLTSVFKITNALLPLLGASKKSPYPAGRIINISSVSGLVNTPMLGPYCISKHALESMSDIYRRELSIYGIKLILIEPGPIQTPIWGKSVPDSNPYEDSDFSHVFNSFAQEVEKTAAKALPVEKVSEKIFEALTKKSPSNRYIISRNKWTIRTISSLVPSKWLDRIFYKQLKKHIAI